MTLILPLPDPSFAAHDHCWLLCWSDLLHPQTRSQQQRQLPNPAWLLNPTQQKHPIVAGLSMFFVLPKVLGPARWERQILCGLGSLDVCGKLFAAIEVPVLSEALVKHQCWDLVLLLFVTLVQADLVQSECKEFQLFSHY